MPRVYELFADEAWTHGGDQQTRYWCFYGGVFGPQAFMENFERELKEMVKTLGLKRELKWTNVSLENLGAYIEVVDFFLDEIATGPAKYRQMFMDRAFAHAPEDDHERRTPLDVQFMLYYQFLKHHFEFASLPQAAPGEHDLINIWLDNHSSSKHTESLTKFAEDLPESLKRKDLKIVVRFVESKRHLRLQVCDILMGAAGSYGNRMHKRRLEGAKRMTSKQKCRFKLGKHIYDRLRALDSKSRGSKAFNWFESTGLADGNISSHKIRIWKFIPRRHIVDDGWKRWSKTGEYNQAATESGASQAMPLPGNQ